MLSCFFIAFYLGFLAGTCTCALAEDGHPLAGAIKAELHRSWYPQHHHQAARLVEGGTALLQTAGTQLVSKALASIVVLR